MQTRKSLKGTWPQALLSFFGPLLVVLFIRWAFVEPFVIPSGSMIPNLLVNDHVFVKKFSYGLRLPFTDHWLVRWSDPQPGDVIVFRYPRNPSVFFIKRLIGRPGDKIRVNHGRITVNGQEWPLESLPPLAAPSGEVEAAGEFNYFTEKIPAVAGGRPHTIRFMAGESESDPIEWTVPEKSYFFMGDNRDQSSDSRVWGYATEEELIGKAWFIWLSCDQMMESAKFVCNPATLRWNRFFKSLAVD